MFRLTTFGGVGLVVTGTGTGLAQQTPAPDLPPRSLALLALIAAAPGPGISRDALLAYLWPESDAERGRNALRQALHILKREVSTPDLVTGSSVLRLNPQVITSDVQEFAEARTAGDHAGAVARYGGPFLDGFHLANLPEFESWVEAKRAEYAAQAAAMLETLARAAAGSGDAVGAVEWWRRLAALDPLSTRIAIGLIEASAAAGDPAGALRHARTHEELIRRELGTPVDPALAAVTRRIRSGEPPTSQARPPAPLTRPTPAESRTESSDTFRGPDRFRERVTRELSERYLLEEDVLPARDGPVRSVKARDRRHNRPVTLRIMHPALASQVDVERFVREIRLTGKLLHPHILPLLDSGEAAGLPWYVVPMVDGVTLRQRLTREIRLPADEALRLTRELADALGHAHAHGVVHRDVNPENVLLAGGHALLANLGLARALDTAAGGNLTDTGVVVGTPAYMSPEQAEAQALDGRSDQYSLAAVLVEMLTGEPLFSGPTPQSILAKRTAEPTPAAGSLRGVPSYLTPVLRKALARRPEERFATMESFAEALAAPGSLDDGRGTWWRRLVRRLREIQERRRG